jgi:hypothetical protein
LGSVRYGNEHGTHKAGDDRRLIRGRTGNLVLQDTLERLFVQNLYADIERGLFLVRGENVSLLGEIVRWVSHTSHKERDCHADRSQDLDKDDYVPPPFEQASVETVFALKKAEDAKRKKMDRSKQKQLAAFGFEGEHHGEAILWRNVDVTNELSDRAKTLEMRRTGDSPMSIYWCSIRLEHADVFLKSYPLLRWSHWTWRGQSVYPELYI